MEDDAADRTRWQDPVVAEVRAARRALMDEAGGDITVLARKLREMQASSGRRVIVLAIRLDPTAG